MPSALVKHASPNSVPVSPLKTDTPFFGTTVNDETSFLRFEAWEYLFKCI